MSKVKLLEKFKEYHFEFRHLTVLFIVLFAFQLLLSFINKSSISDFLSNTQKWYQKDSAERLANLTTTSFELLLESINPKENLDEDEIARITQSFDIIFSQQMLQHNIEEICVIVHKGKKLYAIDDGKALFAFLFRNEEPQEIKTRHKKAIQMYENAKEELVSKEQIYSTVTDKQTFNTFVPFVLRGEVIGVLYIRNTPDFSLITNQVVSSFDETSVIYLSLILLGLLAMYFISSYTVRERDEAQKLLFEAHETNLKKQINYEKELLFTKRIYHTHHKAEKVMGFIKDDLRQLSPDNTNDIKYRVSKYSNFVSRVIYDMKWYDPPVQTIRNQIFRTDLNEVVRFIVDNIFLRISSRSNAFDFRLELDESLPQVGINEFVVWEILEPLMQNSIEHGGEGFITITVKTRFEPELNKIILTISDDGIGIRPDLLEVNKDGVKKLFQENVTSKVSELQNSGYGCYIAYEMSKRCGWEIDAENLEVKGCRFIINIKV
ncbi:MAG TPA: ATP-binding protein [Ignavibacteriales bacterium]|nr:ATP-binding protein [Ignavibacteriales bacterium]